MNCSFLKITVFFLIFSNSINAQTISEKMDSAVHNLLSTEEGSAATMSVTVKDLNGKMLYSYFPKSGLSTASTQKIFTAACILETLGKDYRYTTTLSYSGKITGGELDGNLYLNSNGDPTLGSWRYDGYKPDDFKQKILASLQKFGIKSIKGNLILDDSAFDFQTVPGGWPWNDMGNYYGAGVWGINWRENQFDINLDANGVKDTSVDLPQTYLYSELKTEGDSDQSLIFTAPHSDAVFVNGRISQNIKNISGAMPNPPKTLGFEMKKWFSENQISFSGKVISASDSKLLGEKIPDENRTAILTYQSPELQKIVYWFLRKSINLYGETFIKTLAKEKMNSGSFNDGVVFLRKFWISKGIPASMINFADGSGLSPQNYVSSEAEVNALIYSKSKPWFTVYYDGFPTQDNGMKMKSGTMKNVKSYAGIYNNYVFSIIINNYQGNNAGAALQKVLNNLK